MPFWLISFRENIGSICSKDNCLSDEIYQLDETSLDIFNTISIVLQVFDCIVK